MSRARDVVIVGGGVIGLSAAYRLAQEGASVTLLDRGPVGREASWAGAGLIPANTERLRTSPSVELRTWSAVLYPEWSARLREETGIDNGFRRTGGVDVAATEAEDQELRSMAGRWRAEAISYERLAPADFSRVEPALNPDLRSAYFLSDRSQIRNPRHLRALEVASVNLGAKLHPSEPAVGFVSQNGRVSAVRTACREIACGAVVVAAGAWTAELLRPLGASVLTPPVKGQIVLLRSNRLLLRRIIEHGDRYLVPRDDGRILVGATEEDAGFDKRTTAWGVSDLIKEAIRLCPALAEAEVEASWAGLRPGSIDTRPYIGPLPGFENLVLAAGHKRTGLQQAPATAELVCDLVLGRPPSIDLAPFRPGRPPGYAEEQPFRS